MFFKKSLKNNFLFDIALLFCDINFIRTHSEERNLVTNYEFTLIKRKMHFLNAFI